MSNKELRSFRRAARKAARRSVRNGDMTRRERGKFLLRLRDDDNVEEMADIATEQAVVCGVFNEVQAEAGEHDWVKVGEGIDWVKLSEFFMKILPLLLV